MFSDMASALGHLLPTCYDTLVSGRGKLSAYRLRLGFTSCRAAYNGPAAFSHRCKYTEDPNAELSRNKAQQYN